VGDPLEGRRAAGVGQTGCRCCAADAPRPTAGGPIRAGSAGPEFATLPFSSLYLLDDEWAAEIANRTMRGVMHIGWVGDGDGGYRGQLAVYVRPNGLLGTGYLAAIRPFRHLIVYPRMLRQIGLAWRTSAS
jgi:hypothetical protein